MDPDPRSTADGKEEILIAGFGGQGILFLGQVLAWGALLKGKQVTWLPSYGPAMRGGTANCMVVISDCKIVSPFVRVPHVAIVMNKPSLALFRATLAQQGWLLVDNGIGSQSAEREDIHCLAIPANEIARKLGNGRLANMVMAGAYAGLFPQHVDRESGLAALERLSHGERTDLLLSNQAAFKSGYDHVTQSVQGEGR